jgi:uncharacterized protein YcbK (DUF882 family)
MQKIKLKWYQKALSTNETMTTRRDFLKYAAVLGLGALIGQPLTSVAAVTDRKLLLPKRYSSNSEAQDFWEQPRHLYLHRPESNEKKRFCYWQDGKYQSGYLDACYLLRDVKYGKMVKMNPRVLDLLFGVMAWLQASYDLDEPFVVTSGYRTPEHNMKLEGAAKNSQHLKGAAIDGYINGLPVDYLGLLFASFKEGGVGFYLEQGFVHFDVASVRYWSGQHHIRKSR